MLQGLRVAGPLVFEEAVEEALEFRIATEPWEFEQIHRLNYRTFVNEIPQHSPNPEGGLVDKFHAENTYLICVRGRQLVGMIALRAKRPFSLDAKLSDLDSYLPYHRSVSEAGMLAIEPMLVTAGV